MREGKERKKEAERNTLKKKKAETQNLLRKPQSADPKVY